MKPKSKVNAFERNISWRVSDCIVVGILLGKLIPSFFQTIGNMKLAQVNLPLTVLIWLMIIPMLLKIDLSKMMEVAKHGKGFAVTLAINWLVKPFSMAIFAWLFIRHWFAPYLPADQIHSYIAGLILLAAPCTAMVFVWSNLCDGDAKFTLSQVAVTDVIMLFAFAPLVPLLLDISSIHVPWDTLALSVVLFIVTPILISQIWRAALKADTLALKNTLIKLEPFSLVALLSIVAIVKKSTHRYEHG